MWTRDLDQTRRTTTTAAEEAKFVGSRVGHRTDVAALVVNSGNRERWGLWRGIP
jgi:hypothetical protein